MPPPPPGDDWQSTSEGSGGSTGSSKKTLWWVLGGIGILVVLGIGAVFLLFNLMGLSPSDIERAGQGSPERLAELRSDCDAGDMAACDDLYLESPVGSDDEDYGDTCGGRNEPAGWCVDVHGDTTAPNP